jgi:hypothetical protein
MHTFQDKFSILICLTIAPGALFSIFLIIILVVKLMRSRAIVYAPLILLPKTATNHDLLMIEDKIRQIQETKIH